MKKIVVIILAIILSPMSVHASFVITEIQYNPEGSDDGYEWIEVQNIGETSQDLREYFFLESDVNHRIISEAFGAVAPGEYAVIADKPENIVTTGAIFDSSFSLLNSGEELSIVSPEGVVIDSVVYTPDTGGAGDGSTLSHINGVFVSGVPSPGLVNAPFDKQDQERNTEEEKDSEPSAAKTGEVVSKPSNIIIEQSDPEISTEPKLQISIGAPRTLLAGVPYTFKTEPIRKQSYFWNFGDGTTNRDSSASKTYLYPGEYSLSLSTNGPKGEAQDQTSVTVIEPDFELTGTSTSITVKNNLEHTILIEDFEVQNASSTFIFPNGSYIRPYSSIRLSTNALGFEIQNTKDITLVSPSGNPFATFNIIVSLLENQLIESREETLISKKEEEATASTTTQVNPEPPAFPTDPSRPFITTSIAEAREPEDQISGSMSSFDMLMIVGSLIIALLYVGYTFNKKRQSSKPEDFEDIHL